jgi:hypothetical protein
MASDAENKGDEEMGGGGGVQMGSGGGGSGGGCHPYDGEETAPKRGLSPTRIGGVVTSLPGVGYIGPNAGEGSDDAGGDDAKSGSHDDCDAVGASGVVPPPQPQHALLAEIPPGTFQSSNVPHSSRQSGP